ncbi:MAG: type II secretion system secretin GspD [Gammaproteobacteria bacterium]
MNNTRINLGNWYDMTIACKHALAVLLPVLMLSPLGACNFIPERTDSNVAAGQIPNDQSGKTQPTPDTTQDEAAAIAEAIKFDNGTRERNRDRRIVEVGTDRYTAPLNNIDHSYSEVKDGDITLNFQNTELNEFIKVLLSDILKQTFVIDPEVSGTVTIETGRPIAKQEILPLLDEILAINNAAMIDSDGIWKIVPRNSVNQQNLALGNSRANGNGQAVRIIPLDFISATEMEKILEPFLTEGARLRTDKKRNMLILSGTGKQLDSWQETIDIFDVDWLRGMSVGLYPLEHVEADTLKNELDLILGETDSSTGNELLGGLIRAISIERLNSMLLISSTAAALREAELWLYRLDQPGQGSGQQLYVYELQNAKASELAGILGNVFGSKSTTGLPGADIAPGNTPVELSGSEQNSTAAVRSISAGGDGSILSSGDKLEIIADDIRNSLVILANPQDYKMVASAIKKLDIIPLQVLIEASIIEVTLDDGLQYGVEWFFKNSAGDYSGQSQLDLGDVGLGALTPGFSYTIINNATDVRLAFNALATQSDIDVLSSPSLMVLDNQTASINVGDEIPVPSRQSTSNIDPNAPTVNEIEFRNTGVTLEVTPRVNNSGLVTMEIRQEVSDAISTTTSSIDAPTIRQRRIESTVAITSGETIVLGGLIRDQVTNNESGIPGLYRIPIVGKLFGQKNESKRKTELIVLLTPRVIRDNRDAREVTDEFRRKLSNLPPI